MNNLFVPYKTAKLLKEKGFTEMCLGCYNLIKKGDKIPIFRYNYTEETMWFNHNSKDVSKTNGYKNGIDFLWSAPSYQQATDWLREKHGLWVSVNCGDVFKDKSCEKLYINIHSYAGGNLEDYYKALAKAIDTALKII